MNPRTLKLLALAETALRQNLNRTDLESKTRAHLESALAHVREAFLATVDTTQARTVEQVAGDQEKANSITEKVRRGLRV